jgi:uncharacterized membrane protein
MKKMLVLILLVLFSCSAQEAKYPVVKADGDTVKIPLKDVSDGFVHFYSFKSGGKNINFIVRTDSAGKLHTCFDACFTCYKFKKGYRVEGTDIVCNECGRRFGITDKVWKDVGGCVPIGLPSAVNGDFVLINVSDLKRGEKLF